jgi:diguanylate cyclase (GGDEF)-like protein
VDQNPPPGENIVSSGARYSFRLYVAGDAPNSALARKNLYALCNEQLAGRHNIEVVDVYQEPERALTDRIFMTPALLKLAPAPARVMVGALSHTQAVLLAPDMADAAGTAATAEVTALIRTLFETSQRLEDLTDGEVDTVADHEGKTFLLRHAQEQLRLTEAAKQASILNALPAHIALLDNQGVITSVNDGWRLFATANGLASPNFGLGMNYLDVCGSTQGDEATMARQISIGIRRVLDGQVKSFVTEYPCHSPTVQRWFQLMVMPLARDRLDGAVVLHLDTSLQHKAEERLLYLDYYDELTGLANRKLFMERVAQFVRSVAPEQNQLGVVLIDLERFKNINDSLGREAGDELLRQVATWLTQAMGDASLVARLDADHFAAALPQSFRKQSGVGRMIEDTTLAFREHPFMLNGKAFRVAAQAGIAMFPGDGADADVLFRNAEAALKRAKAEGARYMFYNPEMNASVSSQLTMENQLRQALAKGQFVLHYQPKADLATGKLTSAEALLRWNHPETGLVPPDRFIPLLEDTGMIHEVGRWALGKTVEDYLRWRAAGLPVVRLAINVSSVQLRDAGFSAEVRRLVAANPLAQQGLELEITASVIMKDVEITIDSLREIRALGITIAIDDFGTGYSSLSYLSRLPIDTLKIDRSFVTAMTGGPQALALVASVINMAHTLKLTVVAEGVETEEQAGLLRGLSCDAMQGFLVSKPLPADEFEAKFLALPGTGDPPADTHHA